MIGPALVLALLGLALALQGCPAKDLAHVGDVMLVQADGVYDPPRGATLEVTPGTVTGLSMPAEAVVRLAIAKDVRWTDVEALVATIEGNGKRPVILVGRRHETHAIVLREPVKGPAIQILTFIDGKACVRGPGVEAAKCVVSEGNHYIEKAFVRQLTREARDAFHVDQVVVQVPATMPWVDVVNALDGARTCCGEGTVMKVDLRTSVDDGTVLVPVE